VVKVVGRTATGKEVVVVDVVAAVAVVVVEEGFEVAEMAREVDSEVDMEVAVEDTEEVAVEAVVDIGMEVLVEETTSPEEETGEEEEDTRQIETSQPPMARLGTSFHSAIHMFTQKTADFYRLFLDRLYEVADLLTERPTPEPPDPQEIPSRALNEPLRGLVGLKLPWTRKWIFQLFVKKRRRKISTLIFGRSFPVELQSMLCYLSILPLLKLSICAGS